MVNELNIKPIFQNIFYLIFFFPIFLSAQDINKIIVDENSGKAMVIGMCDRTVFADTNFTWWYDSEYNNYETDKHDLDTIITKLEAITIKIVLGTWCSDSRREVPHFLKILDVLNFSMDNLKMICVDRDKKAEGTDVENLNIAFVPTFIVYRDDVEIGRIIETPHSTLEGDLKNILK